MIDHEGAVQDFTGVFETHLTVPLPGRLGDGDEALGLWAKRNAMKYTRIRLDRGSIPDQPMLTYGGKGVLSAQRLEAQEWVGRLQDEGFSVARVKIEAAPWNADVPQTAEEAAALPAHCYFEHHVKLVLAGDADVAVVRALGGRHAAHVSWNARRGMDGGRHERFVTQRCRGVGRPEARRRLQALLGDLADSGHAAVEVEEEFVVHDDNPDVDAGWGDGPDKAA
ncbi:hypothetical protein AB0E08_44335 [Streptomyces sp. NPDC048281]|uniref:hypothetical protein n=1 Tax=Streptomyces sp. NPDC048281 TaxID=3154715 RepID=UPI0034307362